jgi:hypothetical protein
MSLIVIQITYSQKINEIDYGTSYLNLKEMSYFDYKDNCGDYYCRGTLDGILTSRRNYACSNFKEELVKKDYKIGTKYSDYLVSLIKDFENVRYRKMWNDFSNCSELSYKYVQLLLKKFEIISEYYKDLYNYKIDKKLMESEIKKTTTDIDEKYDNKITNQKRRINNDEELDNLISQKEKSINDINAEFGEKINKIKKNKDSQINGLEMKNYVSNKDKIIKESKTKINLINIEKAGAIESANIFWSDKINFRENKLKKEITSEIEDISEKEVKSKIEERKEIVSDKNLNSLREDIENKFKEEIKKIDLKINELINK